MLIAGLIDRNESLAQTANLINVILTSLKHKTSIVNSKNLAEWGYSKVKNYINELEKNGTSILILKIDVNDINFNIFKYFQFDIILYALHNNENDSEQEKERKRDIIKEIRSALNDNGIMIINDDFIDSTILLDNLKIDPVTYGFNSKASITTSSIDDTMFEKGFMFYQRKPIKSVKGKIIGPQEYRIDVGEKEIDVYGILGAVAFAVASGVEFEQVTTPSRM